MAAADRVQEDVDDRALRAATELMVVRERSPASGIYVVTASSGAEYRVDPALHACNCPDQEYRDVECKHVHRVRFELGLDEPPVPVDDPLFRRFVSPV